MRAKEMETVLNDLFQDCLNYFSDQVDLYFGNSNEEIFVFNEQSGLIDVNENHPLFTQHKENIFALVPLAETFLRYSSQQLRDYPSGKKLSDVQKAQMLRGVTENVQLELYRRLETVTFGLSGDFVTALSGEMYESAATKDYLLAILPSEADMSGMKFSSKARRPLESNHVHAIRKQLNIAKKGALAVAPDTTGKGSSLVTIGIIDAEQALAFPRFRFLGHMRWEFELPSSCQVSCRIRYAQGHLMLPGNVLEEEILYAVRCIANNNKQAETIRNIILCLLNMKKGAVAIFSEKAAIKSEVDRLVHKGRRGIAPASPLPLSLCTRGICGEGNSPAKEQNDTLDRITEIDGAILIDTDGNCHAFGVILDGLCAPGAGDIARGARYNSTQAYICSQRKATQRPCLGVVISEDGMFNLFL